MPVSNPDAFEIFRNRDKTLRLKIGETAVGDITGSKLWLTVKADIDDTDANAIIYLRNTEAGGDDTEAEILDGPNRELAFHFDKEDTYSQTAKSYLTDAAIELPSGKRYQLLIPRRFIIKEPVTKTPQ